MGAWVANTRECLAMLLRPGNAGSNTFADHKEVLAAAVRQVPARFRKKIMVRVDGAGASHELIRHLLSMSSPRRILLFTCGWMITAADEDAIRQIPADAWKPGIGQDGQIEEDKHAAEITGLMSRAGNWPDGLRWIVRRVKPSRRQIRNLTDYEKKTGWRYSITCTNIPDTGIIGLPGSHHPQYIDVVHREHAVVETERRPHRQGHGTAEPAIEVLAGQHGLGHRGEHRRRPDRLDPPPRLPRPRGPERSRAGHAPLPDLAHPRPARPPRPAARPQDQRRLAVAGGIPYLLAAAVRPARARLTSTKQPVNAKGEPSRRSRSRCAPGHTGQHLPAPPRQQPDTRPKPGTSTISNHAQRALTN